MEKLFDVPPSIVVIADPDSSFSTGQRNFEVQIWPLRTLEDERSTSDHVIGRSADTNTPTKSVSFRLRRTMKGTSIYQKTYT